MDSYRIEAETEQAVNRLLDNWNKPDIQVYLQVQGDIRFLQGIIMGLLFQTPLPAPPIEESHDRATAGSPPPGMAEG